jgi:hypothetical protein
MACQFVDLLRSHASIGSQGGNNGFDTLGGECRSAPSAAHFRETLGELRGTVYKNSHGLLVLHIRCDPDSR